MKKAGFVYLDELQHIHHFLSPAVELARRKDVAVDILTYEGKHEYLRSLIARMGGDRLNIVTLSTFRYRKVIEKLSRRLQPSALYIYKKHLKKFLSYDVLVFTDHTAGPIHAARRKRELPRLVFIDHGAGDGAYGYKESHRMFDLIVVAGAKKAVRLTESLPGCEQKIKIGGYAKFDVIKAEQSQTALFSNANPVVLYCPHFSRELSSWYKMGYEVLEFFLAHPEYNLIFAPHYNLFNKKGFAKKESIEKKFFAAANIHIDLGSIRSVNMTYTLGSDVYLGDVSSQVYEFMYKPRPLIFLNTNRIDWREDENYLMWQAGRVVENTEELEAALRELAEWPSVNIEKQKELFARTFYKPESPAGARIAGFILEEAGF